MNDLQSRIAAIKAECERVIQDNKPILSRHQLCGCVVCVCDDDNRCQGCGSKNCGNHPVAKIPKPVYVASNNVSPAMARVVLMAIDDGIAQGDSCFLEIIADRWEDK